MVAQLEVTIDRNSPVPLYHQLSEQMTAAISDGRLRPGDPFENELSLAERLGLSRPTVRRAISELVVQGLLVRRRGIGTTVANSVVHRRDELTSLHDDLARAGRSPRTEVLTLDANCVDEPAAGALQVPPETPLVFVERLRFAGDEPLAILANWLPPQFADLTRADLESDGLYNLLHQRSVRPVVAHQTIGARSATGRERRLLGMGTSQPLLTMSRHAYDADGRPVEFGDHCYRADLYAFDITVHER
ncbi:GntR family transcriptional regulator [Agilicoccus flavus]|uniref:GntR family transcriptional regulator n=1 Tax=Agilicoccus flavus TaxID=2775968 RepID=UPI001CF6F80E|nr:GntR family transcriptional regulator [Agilicoccus flavus]